MCDFTVLLPIKGTEQEMHYIEKSLKSAYALEPDHMIIALDEGCSPFILAELDRVSQKLENKNKVTVQRIFVEKDPEWSMQLAKIVWKCYGMARHDKIYHFDIDHTVNKVVLKGKDQIKGNVALVSFTKQLYINGLSSLFRFIVYRIRVRKFDNVFSGNYWVSKKAFFDLVDKEEYKKINNGIDTYLIDKIAKSDKYQMITRKEMGVKALGIQNEDYDWRQFLDGVWYFANLARISAGQTTQGVLRTGFFRKHPKLQVLLKVVLMQRYGLWRGYRWAKNNAGSKAVGVAEKMDFYDWSMEGTKYLPKDIKFKDIGTGHHEY